MFLIGEKVSRNSHNNDIVFRVVQIRNEMVILESLNGLLIADSPLSDLRSEE